MSNAPASQDRQCDLCGRSHFELLAQHDRKGQPLETVVCTQCGLVSHRDIPTDEEVAEFYAHDYRQQYHGEYEPSARRVMRAWLNGERIRRQVESYVPDSTRVLEVGAGIGCTVKQFELSGYRAQGIEPHEGFSHYGRHRLRASVKNQFLFDLARRPTCDMLLLVHVIEHFNSPRLALEYMHDLVRPDGYLYVECPNFAAPFARRDQMFHFAHIHNFTPTTLRMLARRCGFEQEQCFSQPHDPNLQVLFRRVRPRMQIEPGSYHQSVRAYRRYNRLTYHARWNYLWPRVCKTAGYLREHVVAERFVKRVIKQCETSSSSSVAGDGQSSTSGRAA